METLAECIREFRKLKGMLVRDVADVLDVDPSLLSRIECGKKQPTRSQVVKLAEILAGDAREWLVLYFSERLVRILKGEDLAMQAMAIARKRIAIQYAIV